MKRITKEIDINASKEKVWNVLLGDTTYPQWTAAFAEGSSAETDWKEGSKVLFTDGKGSGMIGTIAQHIPNEFIKFTFSGVLKDNVEDTESDTAKMWSQGIEQYTLTDNGGISHLKIESDMTDEYYDMMNAAWDKALAKVKELAETA